MIKYKCRPAIHTKIVCEYCDSINYPLPDEYTHFKYLSDKALISFNTITNLLNYIERSSNNPLFFVEFVSYFIERIEAFTEIDLSDDVSSAKKLVAFTQFYNEISDVDWHCIETPNTVGLLAKRCQKSLASKYDDLFVYVSVMHVLKLRVEIKSNLIICLPFDRSFYGDNVELLSDVTFNCQSLSVFVDKDEPNVLPITPTLPNKTSSLERVSAAANSIPPTNLTLATLANMLGMSTRSLQREVQNNGCCVKDIIKETKVNAIVSILNSNKNNIKVTAYECGFNSLPSFSRYFSKTIGCSPTEYVKRQKVLTNNK